MKHIGKNDYKIGNILLSEERDLGVYLSNDLKPSLQCVKAAKKASTTFSTF